MIGQVWDWMLSGDVPGMLIVLALVWTWAGILYFLPAPAPKVERRKRTAGTRGDR